MSGRTSTPGQGSGGRDDIPAGFGGSSRGMSGRRLRIRNKAVMPLLVLIMALVIIITVLAILLVISWEKSPQATTLSNSPNKPVDASVYEVSGSREGFLEAVTNAETSTLPPDFDWAESLWSDIFEYN